MQLMLNTIMLEPNRWARDEGLSQPLIQLLQPIQDAGFAALEIWQYHISELTDGAVGELARTLGRRGLTVPAVGAYPPLHLEGGEAAEVASHLARIIATAAGLGATTLKIFPGRVASAAADAPTRDRSVARLRALAGTLAEREMQLTLETHANTLCDTLESTEQLLEELRDVPNVGLCFQPYGDQGTDAAMDMFDRLRPAVRHVHLQNRGSADRACTCLADGDWIDYTRLLPHLRASGFDGLLGLEFTAGLFPEEGEAFAPQVVLANAKRDHDFVTQLWGPP
jgi:sugar phosphate isomerase/epimerase